MWAFSFSSYLSSTSSCTFSGLEITFLHSFFFCFTIVSLPITQDLFNTLTLILPSKWPNSNNLSMSTEKHFLAFTQFFAFLSLIQPFPMMTRTLFHPWTTNSTPPLSHDSHKNHHTLVSRFSTLFLFRFSLIPSLLILRYISHTRIRCDAGLGAIQDYNQPNSNLQHKIPLFNVLLFFERQRRCVHCSHQRISALQLDVYQNCCDSSKKRRLFLFHSKMSAFLVQAQLHPLLASAK